MKAELPGKVRRVQGLPKAGSLPFHPPWPWKFQHEQHAPKSLDFLDEVRWMIMVTPEFDIRGTGMISKLYLGILLMVTGAIFVLVPFGRNRIFKFRVKAALRIGKTHGEG
ncbi:MAG TPA: hypothetical protein PLI05_08785 [Methanotrichaceae archaeon]|nr:hypothetical protein [Methanotrichaceae archaeon]HQI91547.1 hypothetical protein [Methanotrichaceae archaeon]